MGKFNSTGRFGVVRSTRDYAQITPRSSGRGDVGWLALNDAGHGVSAETVNPIFYGLGCELEFSFNAFVRSWTLEVIQEINGEEVVEDITDELTKDLSLDRRYRLQGAVGVYPLAVSAASDTTYNTPQVVALRLTITNSNRTRQVVRQMAVYNLDAPSAVSTTAPYGGDIRHCEEANDCDFSLFQPINKAGVRVFENMTRRLADEATNVQDWDPVAGAPFTEGRPNQPVGFYFDTLDNLITAVPTLTGLMSNYDTYGTVAVEFTNSPDRPSSGDERCGDQGGAAVPGCSFIGCCCTWDFSFGTTFDNVTTTTNDLTSGDTVDVHDVIRVTHTIPTSGGAGCIAFDDLNITLPGLDSTGGIWALYDAGQPGGPVFGSTDFDVLVNGVSVNPARYRQSGADVVWPGGGDPGDGTGNSMLLDFSGIAFGSCGDIVTVIYSVYPVVGSSTTGLNVGLASFDNPGPCNPLNDEDHPPGNGFSLVIDTPNPVPFPPGGGTPSIGGGPGTPGGGTEPPPTPSIRIAGGTNVAPAGGSQVEPHTNQFTFNKTNTGFTVNGSNGFGVSSALGGVGDREDEEI